MKPYSPHNYPPVEQWPTVHGPVCNTCDTDAKVNWRGTATDVDTGEPVTLWECGGCRSDWCVPVTHWPVLEGPNCPVCGIEHTFWAAMAPDRNGDLWMCEGDHEFVLTLEGLIVIPEDAA